MGRLQVNIRLTAQEAAELAALVRQVHAATGMRLQQGDVFRAGLAEWRRRYPAEGQPPAPARQKGGEEV